MLSLHQWVERLARSVSTFVSASAGSVENHLENRCHRATLGVEHQEWRDQRPATAREATVPWLNESRCAREDLENASHGQADCLAFFIAPGAFHQRKGERIKCQFSRIGPSIT